jgi:hypothetical protein
VIYTQKEIRMNYKKSKNAPQVIIQTTLIWLLIRTPIFEWNVVWCGFNNEYQKGIMSLKEIELHAQNMITIVGSTNNKIGGTYITI